MINNNATLQELWRENAMLNDLLSQVANSRLCTLSSTMELRLSRWKHSLESNNKAFTLEQVDQVRTLREVENLTDAQIGGLMGRTGLSIREICKRHGIPNFYKFHSVYTEEEIMDAKLFREKGYAWKEVAKMVGDKPVVQLQRAVRKKFPGVKPIKEE